MIFFLLAPLRESLRPHFNLSKSRLETVASGNFIGSSGGDDQWTDGESEPYRKPVPRPGAPCIELQALTAIFPIHSP